MSKRERQDGTGRDGTRSHFQVGFRTARPLEGTSNDSDIAAREFKSLTPSGSLSTRPRIACLLRFLRVCLYTYTSISLSISPSTRSKGGKKIFRIQSGLIKYSILHGRSIFARIETEGVSSFPADGKFRSLQRVYYRYFAGPAELETPIKLIFSDPRRENKSGTDWIEFPGLLSLLSRSVDVREGWF